MTFEELEEFVNEQLPDNRLGLITPERHRSVLQAVINRIKKCCVSRVDGVITSAQILNSFSNPVQLIPAPPAGKMIFIETLGYMIGPGTPYTTTSASRFTYNGDPGETVMFVSGDVSVMSFLVIVANPFNMNGNSFVFETISENPTGGDLEIYYSITYRILDYPF